MSPVDQYRPRTGRRPRPRSDCALIGSRRGAPLDNLVTARSKQRAYTLSRTRTTTSTRTIVSVLRQPPSSWLLTSAIELATQIVPEPAPSAGQADRRLTSLAIPETSRCLSRQRR